MVREKVRLQNVDFLRFAMALMIVYYHILHGSVTPFVKGSADFAQAALACGRMWLVADMFFILGGVFLWNALKSGGQKDTLGFIWGKVVRLWPALAVALLFMYFTKSLNGYVAFLDMLFLQCIGIIAEYKGLLWYVSSFFWAIIFIFVMSKTIGSRLVFNFVLALITYFGYVANMQATHGGLGREIAFGVVCLGLWRAVALIGVGIFIAELIECLQSMKHDSPTKSTLVKCVFWTIVEAASVWTLYLSLMKGKSHSNATVVLVAFCALVFSCLTRSGLLARALDCKALGMLGRYAYSIYVFQVVAFKLMALYLWPHPSAVSNFHVCMFMSCAFAVILGIAGYHLVEKPGAALMRRLPGWLL